MKVKYDKMLKWADWYKWYRDSVRRKLRVWKNILKEWSIFFFFLKSTAFSFPFIHSLTLFLSKSPKTSIFLSSVVISNFIRLIKALVCVAHSSFLTSPYISECFFAVSLKLSSVSVWGSEVVADRQTENMDTRWILTGPGRAVWRAIGRKTAEEGGRPDGRFWGERRRNVGGCYDLHWSEKERWGIPDGMKTRPAGLRRGVRGPSAAFSATDPRRPAQSGASTNVCWMTVEGRVVLRAEYFIGWNPDPRRENIWRWTLLREAIRVRGAHEGGASWWD